MLPTERFRNTKVLIVGDVMLDRYWWGSVSRISPEAPVPIVRLKNATLAAGGAANVAANIAGLGAEPVLVGIIGKDAEGSALREQLTTRGVAADHLVAVDDRPTTVKTRVIAHSQQVTRIDQEMDHDLSDSDTSKVLDVIGDRLGQVDAVIISDYAKGLLTTNVLREVIDSARRAGKSVLVDPKGKDYTRYTGASLLTPNRKEAAEACKLEENGHDLIECAGRKLLADLDITAVLITQGEEGMTLFQRSEEPAHFHALARQVYDVTGAGDTVIATLATAVGSGSDLRMAAKLANIAAGIVVEQVGTTSITAADLEKGIQEHKYI
jgi:D-beta-D-heptose 7-phosphate kinase/D-beta-D-heptose 1-phosphate adenosyltransferase